MPSDDYRSDDEYIESIEYIFESIANGQLTQATKLFTKSEYTIEEFMEGGREYGLSTHSIDSAVSRFYEAK